MVMDLQQPAVWQVSSGPVDRPYAELFLEHGVALIGDGNTGPWSKGTDRCEKHVCRFAEDLRIGDLLLLRSCIDTVIAVGLVAGEYEFLDTFDDVQGWDLCHARRVRWLRLPEPFHFDQGVFGAHPRRIAQVRNTEAVSFARSFLVSGLDRWQEAPLPPLPSPEPELDSVPEELRSIVGLAHDLHGLYADEDGFGVRPNENEMTAHFVVPFLRALGWPQEQIGVEWKRVDVALFSAFPRNPATCRFVIEVKKLDTGLDKARRQAESYAEGLGSSCDIIVTDGFRYHLFDHNPHRSQVAYANLVRLKQSSLALFERLRFPQGVQGCPST